MQYCRLTERGSKLGKAMKKTLFDNPFAEKLRDYGTQIHKVYKFSNNYGANIIRLVNKNEKWCLRVVDWNGKKYMYNYDTSITTDTVMGLTNKGVEKLLVKIESFPNQIKKFEGGIIIY